MLWLQDSGYAFIIWEANDNIFEGESPFKKARRFAEEVNFKILQNEANNGPPETGGKK